MKKLLSIAISAVMMLSTATAAFAFGGYDTVDATSKMWISYEGFDETNYGYKYSVNYDLGMDLTGVTMTKSGAPQNREFTGTGLSQVSFKIGVDTEVFDWDYSWGMGSGIADGFTVDPNSETHQLTFSYYYAQTDPTKFSSQNKGEIAWFVVMPKDESSFDPEAVKLAIDEALIFVMGYNNSKYASPATWTKFASDGSGDCALDATFGVEVLQDVAEDGKIIVAHTENVEGVKATTTVDVTYGSETKTFGDFGTLLGISGEGTADGTVRFAVKAPNTMDPNGFLFKINY